MHDPCRSRRALLGLSLAAPFVLGAPGFAQAPPAPRGRPVLDLAGLIEAPGGAPLRLDLAQLDALPQGGFTSRTPWFDAARRFTGVSGAGLVAAIGARGSEVVATALNDYAVTIPMADFTGAGLILATRLDGEPMSVREKGPVWVVYPFDAEARLRSEVFYSRSIWQLRRLEFRG